MTALTVIVLALITTQPAWADTIAFSFPEPGFARSSVQGNDGFQFQPTTPILVTALGYYDRGQNGLSLIHTVGIYDVATRARLVSVDVKQGNASTLTGLFRYSAITPLLLDPSRSYQVVGFHPGSTIDDFAAENPPGLTIAPEIKYQGYFTSLNPILTFPTTPTSGTFFGPNFQFRPVNAAGAIPEPTSLTTVIVVGALGLLGYSRRARARMRSATVA